MPHLLALPPEVLDMIISHLFEPTPDRYNIQARYEALSILCSVNKGLRARTLPKLYEYVRICNDRMENAFDRCITGPSRSKGIGGLVKSLFWISATSEKPQGKVERPGLKLRYVLSQLEQLEEITMSWPPDLCYLNDIAVATNLKKLHLISPKVVALVRTSPMIHLTHLSILNPLEVDTVYGLLESRPLLPNLISLTLIVTLIITSSESFRYPRQKSRPLAKGSSSPASTNATNSILPHIKTLVIGMHGLGGCFAPPPKDFDGQHCCTAFDTLTGLMDILKHCTTLLHLTFISPASNPTITDITSNFLALPPSLLSYTHVPIGTFTTGVKASDPFWRDNAGKQLERFLRKDPSSFLKLKVLGFHQSWSKMIEEVLGKEEVGSVRLVGNLEETDGLIEYYIRLANF